MRAMSDHAGRLDERQRLLDLVELRLARGRRAGHPDDRGARAAERLLGVVLRHAALVVEARVGREEQVGDRGGAPLARRRAHLRVAQRDGRLERLERRVAAVADGERGVELAALGVLGQAAGVALDDRGVGGQREAEHARGQRLRVRRAAALGREVVERRRGRVAHARQRNGRGDGRGDPRERNDVAQARRRPRRSREPSAPAVLARRRDPCPSPGAGPARADGRRKRRARPGSARGSSAAPSTGRRYERPAKRT